MYDKIKRSFFPMDDSRYRGLDYLWRVAASSSIIMGVTAFLTYPLDLIHTRLAMDMSHKGQKKLYSNTFDCFNRTVIDEGGLRLGIFKGF